MMERVHEGNLVEIFRLTPQLYFRRADLMTRGQCNGAYFFDGENVGVVDVPTMEGAQEIVDEAKLLFGRPVSSIFITHGHEDHVEGLPFFRDRQVTVFCSERLVDRIAKGNGWTIVGVRDRTRVRMAGLELECVALDGTAHSPWDMVIRVPVEKVLITGDTVVDFSILHFHSANVENWIANLRRLSLTGDQLVLPGHGEVYPYSKVAETADFIETLRRAGEYCLSTLSPEEIAAISEQKIGEIVAACLRVTSPKPPAFATRPASALSASCAWCSGISCTASSDKRSSVVRSSVRHRTCAPGGIVDP